jgi:hypothetical protein
MCPQCGRLLEGAPGRGPDPHEEWSYQVMGEEVGPLSFYDLRQLARERKIGPETRVRRGTGRWLLAEQVAGLSGCWTEGLEEWLLIRDGKEVGPVSFQALRRLITSGSLAHSDRVRRVDWDAAVAVQDCIARELFPEPLPLPETPPPVATAAAEAPPPLPDVPTLAIAEPPPAPAAGPAAMPLIVAFAAGVVTALIAVGLAILLLLR